MAQQKQNFKNLKIEELKTQLINLRENLRVLRFKTEGAKTKNVKESSKIKKQIARILTEINKK